MKKVTKITARITNKELELATNMILWHSASTGESGLDSMAATAGLQTEDLYAWAINRGFVQEDSDYNLLAMFPCIWREFSNTSRTCLALHTALNNLIATNPKVSAWVDECSAELHEHIKRYG